MKDALTVYRDMDGTWRTKNVRAKTASSKVYSNKSEAVFDARKIAKDGITVIIHGEKGDVEEVIGGDTLIKEAPVKRRMNNRDVNIAIAKLLEKS